MSGAWDVNKPEIPVEVTNVLFNFIRFQINQNLELFKLTLLT